MSMPRRPDAVEGAHLMEAEFVLMETASADYNSAAGTAQMAVHDHGTTVTLRLSNLLPNTSYISHVHEEPCATGGGAHYRFDPEGGELPPNEIHIDFTSGDDGSGFMTAENANQVDETAHSVIVQNHRRSQSPVRRHAVSRQDRCRQPQPSRATGGPRPHGRPACSFD